MSTPSLSTLPQTQNTAPVLEFRCLYTQDLRRKQKRWQDGRLKFHTFNKRVMVYDERSNFIGDTHWRDEGGLNEGEELELERGGILVEVGECIGTRDQDLSELVDKRVREREERAAAKAATTPAHGPRASIARPQTSTPADTVHLRPKPLNVVIGIPTGHYGQAKASNLSPFEQKHPKNQEENERPSKRQKHNDTHIKSSGYAQNLLGATLNLSSSRTLNTQPLRYEPLKISIPAQAETIDLTRDDGADGTDSGNSRSQAHPSNVSAKLQRRKSPHAKSGYAHNLTGAALTLSGSITTSTANPERPQGRLRDPSPASDDTSDAPAHRKSRMPRPIAKFKPTRMGEPSPEISHASLSAIEPRSMGTAQKTPKSNKNVSVHDYSATKLMPEQPMTVLKIKPRPPRRMMMLMDIPKPRHPEQDSDAQVSVESRKISKASNGSCPAQTASKIVAGSSNCDMGAGIIVPSSPKTMSSIPEPHNTDHDNQTSSRGQKAVLEPPVHMDGRTGIIRQGIPASAGSSTDKGLSWQEDTATIHEEELVPESPSSPAGALETRTLQPHTALGGGALTDEATPQPRNKSASVNKRSETTETLSISRPMIDSAGKGGTLSTVSGVGDHASVSKALRSGTRHTQQSPVVSVKLNREDSSPLVPAQEASEPELPQEEVIAPPCTKTATTAVAIKHSPTSLSPPSILERVNHPRFTAKNADHSVPLSTMRSFRPPMLQAPPKTSARSMVNAAVPESNTVAAKKLATVSARAESFPVKGDPGVYAPVCESASRGPWSREAFDLFGAWKPPARVL